MKRSPFVLFALALLAAAAFILTPARQTAVAAEGEDVLHEAMEVLGKTFRDVRRQSKDASKNADTADKLATMVAAACDAKKHLPETASTDDLKKSYRMVMNNLIITLAQAENAALEGNQEKLNELLTAANEIKGIGHEKFIADDE